MKSDGTTATSSPFATRRTRARAAARAGSLGRSDASATLASSTSRINDPARSRRGLVAARRGDDRRPAPRALALALAVEVAGGPDEAVRAVADAMLAHAEATGEIGEAMRAVAKAMRALAELGDR
jgi:hypothetical protein